MRLSVLIPAYNEEQTLEEVIRRVGEVEIEKEIIVVDDCSSDGTGAILSSLRQEPWKGSSHQNSLGSSHRGCSHHTGR